MLWDASVVHRQWYHQRQSIIHSSWTNKLITAKDFGSVQINIGHLDENGVYTNSFTTYALSGPVRFRVCRRRLLLRGGVVLLYCIWEG